jgi:hypothetical protein
MRAEREAHPALLQERLIDETLALMAEFLIRHGERDVAALPGRTTSIVNDIDYDYESNGEDLSRI